MARFNPFKPFESALPPEETRFISLEIEPWENSHRYKVMARITPFLKPPNVRFALLGADESPKGELVILENIDTELVVTLHQRGAGQTPPRWLVAELSYTDSGIVDSRLIAVPHSAP